VFRSAEETEKQNLLTGNQALAGIVLDVLIECSADTIFNALTVMGEIISTDESLCCDLVSRVMNQNKLQNENEAPSLLKALTKILTIGSSDLRKSALWVLSNIVVNSIADAQCVVYSGIINWVSSSLRDPV
jgi:hypothetical protein